MGKYIARIVFHININHGEKTSQFDESIRFIEAESVTDALHKARQTGYAEECTFINNQNNLVEWKFIDVSEIRLIESMTTGVELYSTTYLDDNSRNYIRLVKLRARAIEHSQVILS